MSAAGAAFGIIGAGIPLLAGFIVLDAIAGTVQCTYCGQKMHHSKQAEHSKILMRPKSSSEAHTLEGFDDSTESGLGVSFPDVSWEGL